MGDTCRRYLMCTSGATGMQKFSPLTVWTSTRLFSMVSHLKTRQVAERKSLKSLLVVCYVNVSHITVLNTFHSCFLRSPGGVLGTCIGWCRRHRCGCCLQSDLYVHVAAHILATPALADLNMDGTVEELVIPVSYYLEEQQHRLPT